MELTEGLTAGRASATDGCARLELLAADVEELVDDIDVARGLTAIGRARSRLDGLEARLLGRRVEAGADERRLADLVARTGGVSKSEARRRAQRAARLNELPEVTDALAEGRTHTGNADAVGEAADTLGSEVVRTSAELGEVLNTPDVDQARRSARKHTASHANNDDLETSQQRRHAKRCGSFSDRPDQMVGLWLEFDPVTGQIVRRNVEELADSYYRADGGRELRAGEHPRTHGQRIADAVAALLAGGTLTSADLPAGGVGDAEASKARRRVGRTRRPSIVVGVGLDRLRELASPPVSGRGAGSDCGARGPEVAGGPGAALAGIDAGGGLLAGHGPIPDSVVARLLCDCELSGAVFDQQGMALWLGRSVRTVSTAQFTALLLRDQGCVLCGADSSRCEAHHLMPWEAPGKGGTDITNLALVCTTCHHNLHAATQTLVHDRTTGRWKLRAASPSETSPPPPRRVRERSRGSGGSRSGVGRRGRPASERRPPAGGDPAAGRLFDVQRE